VGRFRWLEVRLNSIELDGHAVKLLNQNAMKTILLAALDLTKGAGLSKLSDLLKKAGCS
jgi:hypothetical protein